MILIRTSDEDHDRERGTQLMRHIRQELELGIVDMLYLPVGIFLERAAVLSHRDGTTERKIRRQLGEEGERPLRTLSLLHEE